MKKDCPHKTIRDWPDCYEDCDYTEMDCPHGTVMNLETPAALQSNDPQSKFTQGVNDINTSPLTLKIAKRRGRPAADGVHVETTRIAYPIFEPDVKRPEGYDEVYIRIDNAKIIWPEGMSVIDALMAWADANKIIYPF